MRYRILAAVGAVLLLAGCSKHADRPATTLTEAQRDSVLAREPVPGASAVGGAMRAAGKEQRHASSVDSLAR